MKANEAVKSTNQLFDFFCESGGWDWAHILLHHLSSQSHPAGIAQQLRVDGDELLESVRRIVSSNDQAYESLSPYLHSCGVFAGAFVDAIKDLESTRSLATR